MSVSNSQIIKIKNNQKKLDKTKPICYIFLVRQRSQHNTGGKVKEMDKLTLTTAQAGIIKAIDKNNKLAKRQNLSFIKIEADHSLVITNGQALFIIHFEPVNNIAPGCYEVADVLKQGKYISDVILSKIEDMQFPDYKAVLGHSQAQEVNADSDLDFSSLVLRVYQVTGVLIAAQYLELCKAAELVISKTDKPDRVNVSGGIGTMKINGVIMGMRLE